MKRFDWVVVAVIVVVVLATQIFAAFSPADSLMTFYTIDDAYYYFKTAQNISLGYGVTFDRINPANGFHPLWMLICIPVFAIFNQDPITPLRAITIILGVLNAVTGVLLYFLLKKAISPWIAGLGSLFWTLAPAIRDVTSRYGLETGISIFSIVLFLLLIVRYRENPDQTWHKWLKLVGIGFSAILVVFARLDNIFLVGIVGLWLLLRGIKISPHIVTDFFLAIFSVILSFIFRVGVWGDYEQFLQGIFIMVGLVVIIRPLANSLLGVSHRLEEQKWLPLLVRLGIASVISTAFLVAILLGLIYVAKIIPSFPRLVFIYEAVISIFLFTGWRAFWKLRKKRTDVAEASNLPTWIKENWNRFLLEGCSFSGPLVISLSIYMAWNYTWFGTFMPISGQIKNWWGTLPNTVYGHQISLSTLWGLAPSRNYGPLSLITGQLNNLVKILHVSFKLPSGNPSEIIMWFLIILVGILFWLLSWLDKERFTKSLWTTGFIPLMLGSFIQFSYYQGSNYLNTRFWYWIVDMLGIVIFLAIITDALYHWLKKHKIPEWLLKTVIALLAIGLISFTIYQTKYITPYRINSERHDWYLTDARGLEKATQKGDVIGMTGGGTVAYFVRNRTIINLDGLMNSLEYFQALKDGDVTSILTREKMKYIFANEYVILTSDPYQTVYKDKLQKMYFILGEEGFTLFRYLPTT